MGTRPYLTCGTLTRTCGTLTRAGFRCPPCAKTHGTRAAYNWDEQRRRAEVVRQWRALHGDVCPG